MPAVTHLAASDLISVDLLFVFLRRCEPLVNFVNPLAQDIHLSLNGEDGIGQTFVMRSDVQQSAHSIPREVGETPSPGEGGEPAERVILLFRQSDTDHARSRLEDFHR